MTTALDDLQALPVAPGMAEALDSWLTTWESVYLGRGPAAVSPELEARRRLEDAAMVGRAYTILSMIRSNIRRQAHNLAPEPIPGWMNGHPYGLPIETAAAAAAELGEHAKDDRG